MGKALSYSKLELLPDHLKNEVNDFIDFLLSKEKKKEKELKKENKVLDFYGILSENEANEITQIIDKGCNKIDNEW